MFLQFTVDNFLSIKDSVTFSMNSSYKTERNIINASVGDDKDYKLLNSAVLYGANGSGKSNLLKAMSAMKAIVLNENKVMLSSDKLRHSPFLLSTETENSSTTFEMVFFVDEKKHRYGFEYDSDHIYSEWLFIDSKGKESKIFVRDVDESYVNPNFPEGYAYFDERKKSIKVNSNQLFLWRCDQNGSEITTKMLSWFQQFNMIDGIEHMSFTEYTLNKMKDPNFAKNMSSLVQEADIGIKAIKLEEKLHTLEELEQLDLPNEIKTLIMNSSQKFDGAVESSIVTMHSKYDEEEQLVDADVKFNLERNESKGTIKFFKMTAPILDTLREGKVLIIDELDSSLHPLLSMKLIEMFQDKNINKKSAQLIFATHDTNLLNPCLFERDQIWFTEKDRFGATKAYSLSEIKGVRSEHQFGRQYLTGKYGAVPYIGKFEF